MAEIALAGPILRGREERWRRFVQELAGSRRREYEGLRRRLGVRAERVWVVPSEGGETAIVCLETEAPDVLIQRLAVSEEPFDLWFKGRLSELHGVDFGRLRFGGYASELVFALTEEAGSCPLPGSMGAQDDAVEES